MCVYVYVCVYIYIYIYMTTYTHACILLTFLHPPDVIAKLSGMALLVRTAQHLIYIYI